MSYSVYVIVPKESYALVRDFLDKKFKPPTEIFGYAAGSEIDADAVVRTSGTLAYRNKKHQKKGALIGFDYVIPSNAVREYLMATLTLLAREVGIMAKFGKKELPTYYYDGEATAIFSNREEARASGIQEWEARDEYGRRVPTADTAAEAYYVMASAHDAAIQSAMVAFRAGLRLAMARRKTC